MANVWPGLGVNYKASSANFAADTAYFQSIGLTNIRVHMPGTPTPWNSATNTVWRSAAQTMHANGFWVTWGTTTGTMNASLWNAYHDSVVAEALYLQQQGIVFDEYELGNELEGAINRAVTSITRSGSVATCTTTTPHLFQNGESVTIFGATQADYNGTFTIVVTGGSTFTYTVANAPSTPATGTIFCFSLSLPQLNANLRLLANDVKAVYHLGKVSYACYNNSVGGVLAYTDWIANGLGGLDTISIHPYGNINLGTQSIVDGGYKYIQSIMQAFGSKCYISEFNIDGGASNLNGFNTGATAEAMGHFYRDYILPLLSPYNSKALVYMWSPFLENGIDDFCMKPTSGSLLPTWNLLISTGATQTRGAATRAASSNRLWTLPTARSSLLFTGNNTDTHILPSDTSILHIGAVSDYTVGARVKLAQKTQSPDNDNQCIANCDLNFGGVLGYAFYIQASTGRIMAISGNTTYQSPVGAVQYGVWQSVIFRITGTTLDLFVQGVNVFTTTISRPATGGVSSFLGNEGTGAGSGKRRLWGNAREFFAVKSALSNAQIAGIAQYGLYPSVGLLYMLDEGGGSSATDSSGNANTGTITGPNWADTDGVPRVNLVTNPSFEHTSTWWLATSSGNTTGLTNSLQDTTNVLYGTFAGMFQANNVGQWYLNLVSAFTPVQGALYTFSAYVYIPIGSLINFIRIGIRDFSSFNYVPVAGNTGAGAILYPVTPGQWTRISYSAIGGAGGYPTWRFTVSDPLDVNSGTASFTSPVSYWVDGTLVESNTFAYNTPWGSGAASPPPTYFDGSNSGGFWTGTADASTSILPAGRTLAQGRVKNV